MNNSYDSGGEFPDDSENDGDLERLRAGLYHGERAKFLFEAGRYAEAVPEVEKMIAADPEDAGPYAFMASVQLSLGRPAEALQYAEQAIAREPEEEWSHRLRYFALAGLNRHDEALKAAQQAVTIAPESNVVRDTLVSAYLHLGKLEEARREAGTLIELAPDEADSHATAALVAHSQERYGDAEKHARDALAIDPEAANAHMILADALWGQKKWTEAYASYRDTCVLAPGSQKAVELLKKRAASRVTPAYLVWSWFAWVVFLAFANFYTLSAVFGSRWAALALTLIAFLTNGLYVITIEIYVTRLRKKQWAEIPVDVQTYIWRGNLLSYPQFGWILLCAFLVFVTLFFLTIGWPVDPHVPRTTEFVFWSVVFLLYRAVRFYRGLLRFNAALEAANPMKPPELQDKDYIKETTDAATGANRNSFLDGNPVALRPENPWAIPSSAKSRAQPTKSRPDKPDS